MATVVKVEVPMAGGKAWVETEYQYQRLNTSMFRMSRDKIDKSKIKVFAFAYDVTCGSSIFVDNVDGTACLYSTRADTNGDSLVPGDHKFAGYLRSLRQLGVIDGKTFRHNMRRHERQQQNNIDADLHTINEAIAAAGITLNKTQATKLATYAGKLRAKE